MILGICSNWVLMLQRLIMNPCSYMEIIQLDEEEKDGKTALGTTKHWHLFHIIDKKS